MACTVLLLAAGSALGGTITRASRPDPLLGGGDILNTAPLNMPSGPCAALADGPDYAAGTDASGNLVAPADVGAAPVPVPDGIAVPLPQGRQQGASTGRGRNPITGGGTGGESAYVQLDGQRLAPLLNPPICGKPLPKPR